jgi:shikimate kinase
MVGMMGAGKTAVGTALARQLEVPFLDSDEEIVRAANRSIAEIFERDGEPFFRAREAEVIGRLLRGKPCVLSTGGGAFLSASNRQMIHEVGVSVWLRADLDLLWQRVRHKTTRPLLRTANPRETLRHLGEARMPFYAQADLTVDSAPDLSVEEMAMRVAQALRTRPDVLEDQA